MMLQAASRSSESIPKYEQNRLTVDEGNVIRIHSGISSNCLIDSNQTILLKLFHYIAYIIGKGLIIITNKAQFKLSCNYINLYHGNLIIFKPNDLSFTWNNSALYF